VRRLKTNPNPNILHQPATHSERYILSAVGPIFPYAENVSKHGCVIIKFLLTPHHYK